MTEKLRSFKVSTDSIILILCIFAVGLYNEYLSCLAAAVLAARLIFVCLKNKRFCFRLNLAGLFAGVSALIYLLSPIWAVDSGMALIGFFKFLPVPLFLLLLEQSEEKPDFAAVLPLSAVIMTVASAIFSFIPPLSRYFTVAGRLAGFFQYSNTYAIFALLALIILISRGFSGWQSILFSAILLFGILYSGSRTVFLIMLICLPAAALLTRKKRIILPFFILLAAAIAAAAIFALASGSMESIGRFLTLSLKESTFLGRILYYKDALPVILKHPLGLGFMGYYYSQQSFQTGVYSVMAVHNDFLQLALDIGWLPLLLLLAATLKAVLKRGASPFSRLSLLALAAHCCLEFNLSFIAIFMLYISMLDTHSGRAVTLSRSATAIALLGILGTLSLYFSAAAFLSYIKFDSAAIFLYPANTTSKIRLLTEAEDTGEMAKIAEDILKSNEYISVAYSALARSSYSEGNFEDVMHYKRLCLDYAPYANEEYREYCYMLILGIRLYENAGDSQSAEYCRHELTEVKARLEALKEKTDLIALQIKDKPDFSLGEEIEEYIYLLKQQGGEED